MGKLGLLSTLQSFDLVLALCDSATSKAERTLEFDRVGLASGDLDLEAIAVGPEVKDGVFGRLAASIERLPAGDE